MLRLQCQLKVVIVALVASHLELLHAIDATVAGIGIRLQRNEFQSNSVIQSLLIDGVTDDVLLSSLTTVLEIRAVFADYIDIIPTLCNGFLPLSNLLGQTVVIGRNLCKAGCLLIIELAVIVIQLTLHRIVRSDGCDRVLDDLNPIGAEALLVLLIIERHDLMLEQRIDCSCVKLILIALVLVGTLLRECPTGTLTIAFNPPTVKHGEVDHTVHLSLLTGCTRCFERTGRRVHPDVHTRNQATGQLHIVVLEEDNLTKELRTLADLINALNQALTGTISRMRLTREEEQNRTIGIVHNLAQTIEIGKQKMGTLIGSKATAEANHQCIGVDALKQRHHTSGIALVAKPLLGELIADILDEFVLQSHTGIPNLLIRYIVDGMPNLLIALIRHEGRIKVFVVNLTPFGSAPCGEVNAIGHIADMILLGIVAVPDGGKHLLAHPAVQLAHAIDFLTGVAGKDTHAETLAVVIRILTAHTNELIPRDAKALRIATHILAKETLVEIVMASRHRRVNSIE